MKEHLSRWAFVVRMRAAVAYSNFTVERAFTQRAEPRPLPIPQPTLLMLGLALLVVAGIGTLSYTGKVSWPTISAIGKANKETAPAIVHRPAIPPTAIPPDNQREEASLPAPTPQAPEIQYALAVDKSRRMLMVLKDEGNFYQVIRKYDISLGSIIGTKEKAGDMRTPVGYYRIIEIKDGSTLPAYYGPRAFVTDYPNRFDQANGRTGGGIWLHGSGQGARTRNTHGCVVLDDDNVKKLDAWVGINTPVAIFPENFRLPMNDGKVDKRFFSPAFFYGEAGHMASS